MIPWCQTFAIQMYSQNDNRFILSQRNRKWQTMVFNTTHRQGYGKCNMASWSFPNFWRTPSSTFCIPSLNMVHKNWLKLSINIGGDTSIKLWKQFTTNVYFFKPIILEEKSPTFIHRCLKPPPSENFEHLSLDTFNCHSLCVISIFLLVYLCSSYGLKISSVASWCPHNGKEVVRKCVSLLGYTLQDLYLPGHPLHWMNCTSLNERFVNILKFSLFLSPSIIRQVHENKWYPQI